MALDSQGEIEDKALERSGADSGRVTGLDERCGKSRCGSRRCLRRTHSSLVRSNYTYHYHTPHRLWCICYSLLQLATATLLAARVMCR